MAQKITQYQAVLQLAQGAPQIYNLPKLHRQMLDVLGIKNAQQLVKLPEDQKPEDPITENQNILMMKPVKAFYYQDHQAHIGVHMAAMQDPKIMQLVGQNPQAQKMMAEIQAHIAEHLAYAYRKKVEEQLGVPMPAPDSSLPEEVEVQLSRMVAMAAQQVLSQSKGQAQQQQAQQQAQDPIVQMQQQELQLKQGELQVKTAKVQGDLEVKKQELQLKMQQAASKQEVDPNALAQKQAAEMQMMMQRHQQEMTQDAESHRQKMAIERQAAEQRDMIAAQNAMNNRGVK
jgi:hypothetical protein